jgi:two-component system C4-dicarboxylate transport response regulator DctD
VKHGKGTVVFIDDDADMRAANIQSLQLAALEVRAFASAAAALKTIDPEFCGVVVSDIRMPHIDGHQLFNLVREIDSEIPVILISGHADVTEAIEAMRRGAYDFIVKPYIDDQLIQCIRRALEKRRLVLENRHLRAEADEAASSWPLIGQSPAIEALRKVLRQVAEADVDTLIEGETGAGKELAARALHAWGPRRRHPFVAVNCGALPATMVESELFGHELGAFPGAMRQRVGRIEFAHRGTLFLDEVEAMPEEIQVKLLRFLAEREVAPLGSNEVRSVDVRVITAAKSNLIEGGAQKMIRPDLYHRLRVAHVHIPPLRDRRSDIPLLFAHFVTRAADRMGRQPPPMTRAAQRVLADHDWPGNVRELANFAERFALGLEAVEPLAAPAGMAAGLRDKVELYEADLIREALTASHGDVRQTLEILHIPRETFYAKARKHEIDIESFRAEGRAKVHLNAGRRSAVPGG